MIEANVRDQFQFLVGRSLKDLTTPAMVLDLDMLERNIQTMASFFSGPTRIRPHIKAHKCIEIGQRQMKAGAIGLSTATLWEAIAFVDAGVPDVFIVNEITDLPNLSRLAELSLRADVKVAVDDPDNAREISLAASAAGAVVGVLIDVDTGMRRCGVRSSEEALRLAEVLAKLPGIALKGVNGYEGYDLEDVDRGVRSQKATSAMDYLLWVASDLRKSGFPIEIVSAGSTGTYDITGTVPGVTEIQAGSYVFNDTSRMPLAPAFAPALTVLGGVLSRKTDTLVIDVGCKTIGMEYALPIIADNLPGVVSTRAVHEEHMLFDITPGCQLRIADRVSLIPGYSPLTVNRHEFYHVVQNGCVVDIWPVVARGAGWPSYLGRQLS